MLFITKRFHFSASHRLFKQNLNDDENEKLYGKCSNLNGHGHNYILEVTIAGEPELENGYIMDLKDLKKIVEVELIEKLDHKNLNIDVDFLKEIIPTSENITVRFWDVIESKINNNSRKLYSLKLFETENNIVEYKGSNNE
jgi:6-pyruvoyltetrahydropterin/6-carboxytetrahydropterin synthase